MNITGKVTHRLPVQSGESQRGPWQKVGVIIDTLDQYPKQICFTCWGDLCDMAKTLKQGEVITAAINIESREYNGNWYTDVRAWKIERGQTAQQTAPVHQEPAMEESDDLPF